MDELINTVSQRAGINPDQARTAIQTVIEHLKGRLPEPLASQIESALQGGGSGAAGGQNLLGEVEGMFGGGGNQ
jgi:uncharacterized protein (DUF2267 family)